MESVWLGKDDAFVAQKRDGAIYHSLRGNYGSLAQQLKYKGSSRIEKLSLNLESASSYCVVFENRFSFNAGSTGLTESDLKEWMRAC